MSEYNMKKPIVIVTAACSFALSAFALCACQLDDEPPARNERTVTYHLNGGVIDDKETFTQNIWDEAIQPVTPERETWIFGGWYTDESLTTPFSSFTPDVTDIYAKWTDVVEVTKDNFKDYFTVFAQWNGNIQIPLASVKFSFTPKADFDPLKSDAEISITVTPKLGSWVGT